MDVCLKKTENKQKRGRGWPIFGLKNKYEITAQKIK